MADMTMCQCLGTLRLLSNQSFARRVGLWWLSDLRAAETQQRMKAHTRWRKVTGGKLARDPEDILTSTRATVSGGRCDSASTQEWDKHEVRREYRGRNNSLDGREEGKGVSVTYDRVMVATRPRCHRLESEED